MNEEQIRQIIREELREFLASDRYIFHKTVQTLDGRNFIFGKGTGTKFGTETTQKMGFFNKTPIVQPGAISAPSTPSAAYDQTEAQSTVNAVNSIRTALTNLGLTA